MIYRVRFCKCYIEINHLTWRYCQILINIDSVCIKCLNCSGLIIYFKLFTIFIIRGKPYIYREGYAWSLIRNEYTEFYFYPYGQIPVRYILNRYSPNRLSVLSNRFSAVSKPLQCPLLQFPVVLTYKKE